MNVESFNTKQLTALAVVTALSLLVIGAIIGFSFGLWSAALWRLLQ